MGFIISSDKNIFDTPVCIEKNTKAYFIQTEESCQKLDGFFIEGYIKHHQNQLRKSDLEILTKQWPLPEAYSGSFAFCLISERKIIIANDCIGIYPLYYHRQNESFTASNSLYELQRAIKSEVDEIGKAERLFGPENSEIGSRTLLKNVKRLLPGEKITFDLKTKRIIKSYDNRLYAHMHHNIDKNQIQVYWQLLRNELKFIQSLNNTSTDIALSGGLDSRILIGAMTSNPESVAYHYGKPDDYETKIANQIAQQRGFRFKSRMDYSRQFLKDILEQTIEKVGPPYSMHWYNIFEMAESHKTNLILGDMCEALHGRNIKAFSTRKSRIKNYVYHYVLNKDYTFTPANKENFEDWKKQKLKSYSNYIQNESLLQYTDLNINECKDQINEDLEAIFKRIEDHKLPYAELYEELFSWFTHSRVPMGRQITHCNERFYAYAPAMSSAIIIASSNIHPNLRLNYRFNNKLFKHIEPLIKLNSIPTSQVPLVSRNTPDYIQFLIWGLRSKIDQILIGRVLKFKNPDMRYRVFKSLNWIEIYQNDKMRTRLNSYFKNDHLPKLTIEAITNLAIQRQKLESWPLANYDIMSIAILNIELDLKANKT